LRTASAAVRPFGRVLPGGLFPGGSFFGGRITANEKYSAWVDSPQDSFDVLFSRQPTGQLGDLATFSRDVVVGDDWIGKGPLQSLQTD